MNNAKNNKRKYKIASKITTGVNNESVGMVIVQFGILAMICVLSFLVAKYIVRSRIDGEKIPIDTSERL